MTLPAFPKPGQVKKKPVAVRVFKGGREVCNLLCKDGREEYMRRKRVMWERQGRTCILCHCVLRWDEATFEHQDGRGHGGGHRDDRIEKDGKPYNGVAHGRCNIDKGSKRADYSEFVP